jgi:hypothetical protein
LTQEHNSSEIYPDGTRHRYYIVTPPYSRFSAGIKVLHLLCHALNQRGQQAFLLILPDMPAGVPVAHPDLLTPRLTQDIIDAHSAQKRTPITVYPETIRGNPLRAPVVARYVLNVPGLLDGDRIYANDELVFSYSEGLCKDIGRQAKMLYLPVTDTSVYHRDGEASVRSGSCYYAKKYKALHPDDFKPPDEDSIEITWEQSPEELADLYRRIEKFYCYESTSAALDAMLCGCPIVSLPNEILKFPIGADSMGMDGHAWGDTPAEIARAKATVVNVLMQYEKTLASFWDQLQVFIDDTQNRAAKTTYIVPLCSPLKRVNSLTRFWGSIYAIVRSFLWRGKLWLLALKAWKTFKQKGFAGVIRKLKSGTVG